MLQVATSNSFDMSSGGPKEHLCEFLGGFEHFYFRGSKITPPSLDQGLLYTWTDSLGTFFATFLIIKISVNDTNTICRSSKSITFPKIWRVWLKN